MNSYTIEVKRSRLATATILIAGLMLISGIALADESTGEKRLSVTTQNTKSQLDDGAAGRVSEHEYSALAKTGKRAASSRSLGKATTGLQGAGAPNTDFWFYEADVVLFNDADGDGYYHGVDLLFDADTYFAFAEVYAVVYLSLAGGPWNEYAVTEDFAIFGASADDEYVLITELVAGYPTGSYDILIELFDAYDDSFVAWFGPEDTSELAFLPLEDAGRDTAVIPGVIVVDRRSGGGSTGWLLLAMLATGVLARARRALRGPCA